MVSEPTRVELDLAVVVLNKFGHMELDNHKDVLGLISQYYHNGEVITLHLIAESTGEMRQFCQFIDEASAYKSKCENVLDADGTCHYEHIHEAARKKAAEALQMKLMEPAE